MFAGASCVYMVKNGQTIVKVKVDVCGDLLRMTRFVNRTERESSLSKNSILLKR